MRIVGPIVEGDAEERVVPLILERLGVRHRSPSRAQGKPDLIKRGAIYAELQFERGASEVLFCFDTDGTDHIGELNSLTQSLAHQIGQRLKDAADPPAPRVAALLRKLADEPTRSFLPVHELEAWLLADEDAISHVVGTPVSQTKSPETDPMPADTLASIFRAAGLTGYRKRHHGPAITRAADHEKWRRCPSYERASSQFR